MAACSAEFSEGDVLLAELSICGTEDGSGPWFAEAVGICNGDGTMDVVSVMRVDSGELREGAVSVALEDLGRPGPFSVPVPEGARKVENSAPPPKGHRGLVVCSGPYGAVSVADRSRTPGGRRIHVVVVGPGFESKSGLVSRSGIDRDP